MSIKFIGSQKLVASVFNSSSVKAVASIFLITGTCVGGGMLALPVAGGRIGFFPAAFALTLAYIFMTITGLLYLEIAAIIKEESHIITMADRFLGHRGRSLCWIIYLFIGYASLVAYLSEGGKILIHYFNQVGAFPVHSSIGSLAYAGIFAMLVACGASMVDRVNSVLFALMVLAFLALVTLGAGEFNPSLIIRQNWDGITLISLFPLMLTTFSYPGIVPVIYASLKRNIRQVRIVVLCGTTLTYLIYLLWLWVILGSVPRESLEHAYQHDHSAALLLRDAVQSPVVGYLGEVFGFLALSTSMIGVGWALVHFLADGLKIGKCRRGLFKLTTIIIVPSLVFLFSLQKVFFAALEMSGGLGDALISGMIPAWMLWVARYKMKLKGPYQVTGGPIILALVLIVSILTCSYELLHRLAGSMLN